MLYVINTVQKASSHKFSYSHITFGHYESNCGRGNSEIISSSFHWAKELTHRTFSILYWAHDIHSMCDPGLTKRSNKKKESQSNLPIHRKLIQHLQYSLVNENGLMRVLYLTITTSSFSLTLDIFLTGMTVRDNWCSLVCSAAWKRRVHRFLRNIRISCVIIYTAM